MNKSPAGIQAFASRCGWLLAATAGCWLLFAGPAWWLAGGRALEGMTIAAVLCFVPGCLVFLLEALVESLRSQTPMLILAGTVLRMLFVLAGLMVVRSVRPDLGFREFTVWLLVFYLAMLLVETWVVTRSMPEAESVRSSH